MVKDMVGVQSLIRSYKKIAEKLRLECLFVFNIIIIIIYHIFVAFNNEQNQV